MNRSITLSLGAAAGGLLASAFLPVAVAFADPDPFTLFGADVMTTVSPNELATLDAAVNADPNLATALDTAVTSGQVPGIPTTAPTGDDPFTELLPAGDTNVDQINTAATLDGLLSNGYTNATGTLAGDPTLAATLATDAATTTTGTDMFPDVPGADAFTIGDTTFDPYTLNADGGQVEGFATLTQGTGSPTYFDTGSVDSQNFDVYSPATSSTAATDLGSVDTTENVTQLFGITNTGFDVTSVDPVTGGSASDLPAMGTVYDVTNYGSGYENFYTDVPGADGSAGTVTDMLNTPFGDYDLSQYFTAFDLGSLDPGAAFGEAATTAGTAAADAVGSIDPLAFLGL